MSQLEIAIHAYVTKLLRLGKTEIEANTALFSSGILDSFAMVDLVSFVEKETGIRVRAKDITLDNLDSISNIVKFVEKKLSD